MKRLRTLVLGVALVWGSVLAAAPPAATVVCIEELNYCCEDIVILGKTIVPIDCLQ